MFRRTVFGLNGIALSVCLAISVTASAADDAQPDALKASEAFDKAMLDIYHRGQKDLTAESLPVMVITRHVTVVDSTGQKTYPRKGPTYDQFKSVAHIVLGFIGSVTPWPEGEAGHARWKADFTKIDAEIEAFLPELDGVGLPPDAAADQKKLLQTAQSFVKGALAKDTLTPDMVADAINAIRPYWAKNMSKAAEVELNALHEAVTSARADISDEDWDKTYIVTHGPSFVRNNGVVHLYLRRVMPEKFDAQQVLFAENMYGLDDLVAHVGYMKMQRNVGSWAFGDPSRMEMDLLGFEAGAILDGMIEVEPPSYVPQ